MPRARIRKPVSTMAAVKRAVPICPVAFVLSVDTWDGQDSSLGNFPIEAP
jgi:hypothetical protein